MLFNANLFIIKLNEDFTFSANDCPFLMAISALEGSRNVEDLKGLTEPVCTATPTPGVHEVCTASIT